MKTLPMKSLNGTLQDLQTTATRSPMKWPYLYMSAQTVKLEFHQ